MQKHCFRIGKIKFKNKIVLAPMAGITNTVYRKICKKFGASLVFTEMISDMGILYRDKKTLEMLKIYKNERPIGVQIFGNNSKTLSEAAKYVEENIKPDLIDINMGCPAKKVVIRGSGAALLKKPELIKEIIRKLKNTLSIPFGIKIRIGWDEKNINAYEIVKIAEENGASYVTIHGRTAKQMYDGNNNWEIIKKIKESSKIPIIGNGDVNNATLCKKILDETKVDAIMIGRASIGKPWIFKEIKKMIKNNKLIYFSNKQIKKNILKHLKLLHKNKDNVNPIVIRTLIASYLKGIKNRKFIINEFFKSTDYSKLKKIIIDNV